MPVIQAVNIQTHPLNGISLIEASAGTGKTYAITHLYVRVLLETELTVKQILVVTFTNAATQELKQRIHSLIYQLWDYLNGSEKHAEKFADLFGVYRSDQSAIQKLHAALINFDESAIYSIHGFCQRVLNTFPIETRSLLQQQIIPNEKEIQQQAIKDYWRKNIIGSDSSRVRWILSQWKQPDNLLNDIQPLIEFETLVSQTLQQTERSLKTIAIDAHWDDLVQQWNDNKPEIYRLLLESKALNRNKIRKASATKLLDLLKNFFVEKLPYQLVEKWDFITTTKLKECQNNNDDAAIDLAFFRCAETFGQKHDEWIQLKKKNLLLDAANQVYASVQQQKEQAQSLSFNDLIKQLSRELTDTPSLGVKIQRLYPLAMVDEFQDTDFRQYNIFRSLYQSQNDESTLILIGDPKQAIYSFRGADVFTYQQAKADTQQQYTLDINYRSSEPYVDMVNQFFGYNEQSFLLQQLIQFQPAKARPDNEMTIAEDGSPATPLVCWMAEFDEKEIGKGSATDYFAECCAQEIHHILQHRSLTLDGEICRARDLTILVKTGFQASTMQNKLANLGIKSALQTRDSVFDSDQAREITLLLEVLIDPSNVPRVCGLLSTDLFGWNAAQIDALQHEARQLTDLLEQFKSYRLYWSAKGFMSMFLRLMDDNNSRQIGNHMQGERCITNWLHIAELLQQESQAQASHTQLLHWLQHQREQSSRAENEAHQLRLESDQELVHIVTIHKSKGLQYPVVFMPFMWNIKQLNANQSCYNYHSDEGEKQVVLLDDEYRHRWQAEAEAEEVRLFYVAMTRARYRCYLGWGNVSGAGSSAIAHCLYPEKIKQCKHPNNLELSNEQELYAPFKALNLQRQRVKIVKPQQFEAPVLDIKSTNKTKHKAKPFTRQVRQQWLISSYSQIATRQHADHFDRPDYDALPMQINESESLDVSELGHDRFGFKKGAKAGNLLHDILEHQVFEQPINVSLIQQKCLDHGFDAEWVECLADWLDEVIHCNLGQCSLSDLKPEQTISEMEFYLSCEQLKSHQLTNLLQQSGYLLEHKQLEFTQITGFMKGFIDLIFEFDERYYIADYKSNHLGNHYSDYDVEHCNDAMHEHHYHLQYLIYSLALHRYLKSRLTGYDYETDFGGVYYLFLRGMKKQDPSAYGVYFHKPDYAVIQQLDELFS